ncbi:hypothetical protein LPJ66_006337 [Kickxella alabastrina]|uniref:Uncharacterized protein n=1 Tax=Kickxella alabastrina TaxID=61397 RepID=A0ACC1ICK7_9FUNG|nr:hypothetical protein LPJ66_006337 [Kickxella alabastrina]
MNCAQNSDTGPESELDVIIEDDDLSDINDGDDANKNASSKKQLTEDDPANLYLPRLKTSIIQSVLDINAHIIRLCQEYQNNSLMDDPQIVIYQMRLQSNLAYLASVADHYLDPTRASPDLSPLPLPKAPLVASVGQEIAAKMDYAREVYKAYAGAWEERQLELSIRAKKKMQEDERKMFEGLDRDGLKQKVDEVLKMNRVVLEKPADEQMAYETYTPFPPFRVPEEVKLPPGLAKWSFEENIAAPQDE